MAATVERARARLRAWNTRPALNRTRVLRALTITGGLALVLAFYYFTAATSGSPMGVTSRLHDQYNQLADALLHGHTALPQRPPRGLLALKDPYDPVANAPYQGSGAHDLSLYHGRYYLEWGPTPALTLFIPFRVLPFLGDLPQPLAVVIFSFVGFVFSLLLLRFLLDRYLPQTPTWMRVLAGVALALGNVAPFILRRPTVYEVAISAGWCFMIAGVYFLLSGGLRDRLSYLRLTLGSVCLGLAVGARPTHVWAGFLAVGLLIYLIRSRFTGDRRAAIRVTAATLAPLVVAGILLLLYNKVRFDSFTQFGQKYQLAAYEAPKQAFQKFAYITPGLYYYLLAPVRWVLAFPYAVLPPPPSYPGHAPADYNGVEMTGGVLTNLPILLVLVAAPFLWWRERGRLRELRWIVGGLVLVALAEVVLLAWTFWGTTERYEMDFSTLFLVAALATWAALLGRVPRRPRLAVAVVGTLFVAYGALVGTAIGLTGYYDSLRGNHPAIFRSLEHFFSPLPTLAEIIRGHSDITRIDNPQGYSLPRVTYSTRGAGGATFWMDERPATVTVIAPSSKRRYLEATLGAGPNVKKGSKVFLVVTSSRSTARIPVTGALARIPVDIGTGLNEIRMKVVTSAAPPLPADNPAAGQIVDVNHLVVVG